MKVACKFCGNYVDRESAVKLSIQHFCSYEHALAYANKPKKKSKKKGLSGELREEVFRLDGHHCRFCNGKDRLEAHHVFYRSQGGPDEQSNLITLCNKCHHGVVHADKKRWQPICLGIIWLRSVYGDKRMTIPDLERTIT